jgi:ferric-dicitrate binding protein FerR (iron transport regulator)
MIFIKSRAGTLLLIALLVLGSCSQVKVETDENFEAVELPDGSVVYLNHNSSVSYDEGFDPRIIDMEGEIFLSVAKGATPFLVRMEEGEIKVLGTEFNVKSEMDKIEVEVEEGIVELKTGDQIGTVKRRESAVYSKTEKAIQKAKAEFKFREWMKELKREFKKLGKEIQKGTKEVGKESKKAGKELKQELKKLKD